MANLNLTQEKIQAIRSEYKQRNVRGKYPRQKMLPEYKSLYPWVLPDEVDPYFIFCSVCECRLSAKKSDLGKHEGSIKHGENLSKKGLDGDGRVVLKGCHQQQDVKAMRVFNYCDDEEDIEEAFEDEDNVELIKHEPFIDLVENSNSAIHLDEVNRTAVAYSEEDKDDDVSFVRSSVRRSSDVNEFHSQNSGTVDCVPRHRVREIPPARSYLTPGTSIKPNKTATTPVHYTPPHTASTMQSAPCKITIKKITAPLAAPLPAQVTTITGLTPVNQIPTTSVSHSTSTPVSPAVLPARDSFELFFDSICVSVKSLPPKLATEGKIRVMQLIGELEMRAISEREQEASSAVETGQQNATVASTTK